MLDWIAWRHLCIYWEIYRQLMTYYIIWWKLFFRNSNYFMCVFGKLSYKRTQAKAIIKEEKTEAGCEGMLGGSQSGTRLIWWHWTTVPANAQAGLPDPVSHGIPGNSRQVVCALNRKQNPSNHRPDVQPARMPGDFTQQGVPQHKAECQTSG